MGALLAWGISGISWTEIGSGTRVAKLAFWVIAGIVIYGVTILALGLRPKQLAVQREPGMFKDDE